MTIPSSTSLLDRLLVPTLQNADIAKTAQPPAPQKLKPQGKDLIRLSQQGQDAAASNKQTRLISEDTEKLDNGFRKTQKFQGADGRDFTRVEEFTASPKRAVRIVVQQNTSGSTTVSENILDRQQDGTFRLTQRFTNEIGETSTNIELGITPQNVDVLLGRAPAPERQAPPPYASPRGSQFDARV